ncbi:MAG TPA: ferrochelatase [Terriglobales bacterium]|nr:ferrochelatase [Terriglobales bacterium]
MAPQAPRCDAVLIVSFGGPEAREEVVPFLENVLRGRNVPRQRLLEVAEHYYHLGGRSPINDQNRALVAALTAEFARSGPALPIYWGNRNWRPLLADTVARMRDDGVRHALAFVTASFGSFSGCRQYLDDIAAARAAVGPGAPEIRKLRLFYNHPGFIRAWVARVEEALAAVPAAERAGIPLLFSAHSIPLGMARSSPYVAQLQAASQWVAEGLGRQEYRLAYQSRSGPPSQPWLEPDVNTALEDLARTGAGAVLVAPLGFLSDHMEVAYDLDCEARQTAERLGLRLLRAATPGTHPALIAMIRELILERLEPGRSRGVMPGSKIWPDDCPADCCLPQ